MFKKLLALKILYLGWIVISVYYWNDFDIAKFNSITIKWPREGGPVFASHFATWDTAHYLFLSEVGYQANAQSCAFYPLWPLLTHAFSIFTGGSHLLAGLILSNLFSLVAFVVFYRTMTERYGKEAAKLALLFLLVFPGSLFFQFHYTESLFFLLLVWLWSSLGKKNYGLAWTMAFLLPMTRPIGLFCLVPIAWHLLTQEPPAFLVRFLESYPRWFRFLFVTNPPASEKSDLAAPISIPAGRIHQTRRAWLLLAGPLAGWGCYLAFMAANTGNPFEGFAAQRYWGVHSIFNLIDIPKFVTGFLDAATWHDYNGSLLDRSMFVVLLYCLPALWRLDKGLCVWTWALGIAPAMSGTFISFTRYASVDFPLFIALASFYPSRAGETSNGHCLSCLSCCMQSWFGGMSISAGRVEFNGSFKH